jgi:hypothetical protein
MAGILTPPTPEQAMRLADALDESWRVLARVDPEFASVQRYYAIAIRNGTHLARPATPAPRRQRAVSGAQKAEVAQHAAEWLNAYRDGLQPAGGTPSTRAIWAAYKRDATAPVIPRTVLMAARPPEWKMEVRR